MCTQTLPRLCICMTAALIGLRECAMRVFFQCPPPCSACSGIAIRPRFHIRVHLGSACDSRATPTHCLSNLKMGPNGTPFRGPEGL